ncbi:MAG TPA: tyrosine--tRNA ligase [Candidatus Pullichristensenella stercorigallinarum]|uniref:Tyrosine--tRNA ligase n=1 Tax=Candidatus Pullichristensenella stercorigallinarum TaxID=2840909 RepID=A0A9D0ZPD6_9FIRM|nr:tyrosine--tRNA ligase [Candidatus Pullichristensenella stercorigallinarum]
MNALDILKERGFIAQVTFEDELYKAFDEGMVTFYTGFDPTADSLHIGHYIPIMAMAHLQRAGHRPIALMGGGTGMIGDPSGKSDLRKMMTVETVDHNVSCIKKQMAKFLDFDSGRENAAIIANNADWLRGLNYIDFLREVGSLFSVNRMLTAECYKQRMEKGLTFLEFNYMIMQSYDFLELFKRYGCILQAGGDDQWSNMLSGADLIRRKEQKPAFALTFKLLLTSDGRKMGKTEKGALWLDPNRTSPYEFYQYWRNVDDADVEKCLALLTFLPMDEVRRLGALKDAAINEAKRVLAYEVTKLIHGEGEAIKARDAAEALFGGGALGGSVPTTSLTREELAEESRLVALLARAGLCKSNGEVRKAIQQGGVSVNDEKVTDVDFRFTPEMLKGEGALVRKGKKSYHRFVLA